MNTLCQLQQSRAGGVDDGCLCDVDQLGIGAQCLIGSELLNDGRLGADMTCDQIGGTEFIEFGSVHANRVGVNRRPF